MPPALPPPAGSRPPWSPPGWLRTSGLRWLCSRGPWLLALVALAWGGMVLRRHQRQQESADEVPDSALRRRLLVIDEWVDLGEAAVPVLRTSLLSQQPRRQSDAAAAAARMGPTAQSLRPELLACLDSDDVSVREQALTALLALPEEQAELLPRLARLLRDPAFALRSLAARGLDQASPDELELALERALERALDPAVVPGLEQGPPENSATDLLRLARCRFEATLHKETEAALRRWLRDPRLDDLLRAEAFELLIWHDAVELDDLLTALAQQGPDLGGLALRQIETWGPRAAEAAPLLARLLRVGSPATQAAGLEALGWLGPTAAPVLPDIERYLHADVCFHPVPAAGLIHQLGGDTPRATALLRRRLLSDVPGPDQPAALARLDPAQAEEVVGILAARVARHDATLRQQLWLLKAFGPAAHPALPSLRPLLAARNDPSRLNALEVCARLGPGAQPALPELRGVLAEPTASAGVDGALQLATLQALSGLRDLASEAIPDLLQALERWQSTAGEATEGTRLDLAGLKTLLDIAPTDPAVQAVCQRWLKDPDPARVLLAAQGALHGANPDAGPQARALLAEPLADEAADDVLLEDLRLALLDTLAATTLPEATTTAVLWQWATAANASLPRRLHALQCLAEFAPDRWPPELAARLVRDIDAWLAQPPGPFPGPSRLAPEGQLFRDRYRPEVQARVSVRQWLRHLRAQLETFAGG